MNPAEFANIANAEKEFWWYRGMRTILFRMLAPHLDGRNIRRVVRCTVEVNDIKLELGAEKLPDVEEFLIFLSDPGH